jgi:Ca2+-binding EF-hand superfamily protein
MFKDIDKEADGEIYYREMVTYLKSLDRDMDQQSNPLVSLVPVSQSPFYIF